jgi:K+-transporting ATPase KdpF subunit
VSVNVMYVIASVIALILLAYLVATLLKPEWFG